MFQAVVSMFVKDVFMMIDWSVACIKCLFTSSVPNSKSYEISTLTVVYFPVELCCYIINSTLNESYEYITRNLGVQSFLY